jgi:hypothetical protein
VGGQGELERKGGGGKEGGWERESERGRERERQTESISQNFGKQAKGAGHTCLFKISLLLSSAT